MNSLTKITLSIFIVFSLFACASKPPAFTEDVCLIFTEKNLGTRLLRNLKRTGISQFL